MKTVNDYIQEANDLLEKSTKASRPTKFKPTHFHMSNLKGVLGKKNAHTKLMYHDGAFWHMKRDEETGRKKIAKWNGNPNNRAGWNPASVDGEIVNGKLKEYPKGVTFADKQKEKENNTDEPKGDDAPDASTQQGAKKKDSKNQYLRNADKATADKEAANRIKRLIELLDALEESIAVMKNAGLLQERELTSEEQNELMGIVADLKILMKNPNLSGANKRMIDAQIPRAKKAVSQVRQARADTQADNAPQSSDELDADSKDSAAPPPEAQDASQKSNDKGADKDADEKPLSGSLAKFAKSGKGGLANDPEETEAIKELQQYLTDLGFDPNGVDGKYGRGTINGVKEFQKYFGAAVDGDAGPETIAQIIKLRSFKFKGGKTFVDFRRDMSRMEELIKKGGTSSPAASESTSFRDLINIVENLLNEALSADEQKELSDLLSQYDDVMSDAEFAAALPKVSYDRYSEIVKNAKELSSGDTGADNKSDTSAGTYSVGDKITKEIQDKLGELGLDKGIIGEPLTQADVDALNSADTNTGQPSSRLDGKDGDLSGGDKSGEPGQSSSKLDGKDGDLSGGGKSGEAAYKVVKGSGQSRNYTTFDADGNKIKTGRGSGPSTLPSKEEWEKSNNSDPRGDQTNPPAADPDATDPRGDQIKPSSNDKSAEPSGGPSGKLDGKDGDLSSKPLVFKSEQEAVSAVKAFAEFADEILPQLSTEEQELFKEIIASANKAPTPTKPEDPAPRDTGIINRDF